MFYYALHTLNSSESHLTSVNSDASIYLKEIEM